MASPVRRIIVVPRRPFVFLARKFRGLSRALHRLMVYFDSKKHDNQYVITIRPPESGLVGKSVETSSKLPVSRMFSMSRSCGENPTFRFASQPFLPLSSINPGPSVEEVKKLLVFLFRSSSSISRE
jgi:hypothetical protein